MSEEELLKRYSPLVRRIARCYYLAGAEPEDVIQVGMIGLFSALRSYDDGKGANFVTYASHCIKNEIFNAMKIANNDNNAILNRAESLEKVMEEALGEEELLKKEQNSILWDRIVKASSPLELKVVKLYLKGHSYEEIGTEIGCGAKAAGNAIYRLRKKLQ